MNEDASKKITVYSLVMALCIVLFHTNVGALGISTRPAVLPADAAGSFLTAATNGLGSVAVAYFFLSSAFLLYRDATPETLPGKLRRRIRSLLVPLLVWDGIYALWEALVARGLPVHSVPQLLWRLFLDPFDGPLWFISTLLLYLPLAPLLLCLHRRRALCLLVLGGSMALALCNAVFFAPTAATPFAVIAERFVRYIPSYLTGVYAAFFAQDQVLESRDPYPAALRVGCIGLYSAGCLVLWVAPGPLLQWTVLYLQSLLVWGMSSARSLRGRRLPWPLQISFLLYAGHQMVSNLLYSLWARLGVPPLTLSIGAVFAVRLLMTAFTYLCITALAALLRRLPALYSLLTGGRAGR